MWASYRSCPLAVNSEKYGSAPQPMNTLPSSSIWMSPWLPAGSGGLRVVVFGDARVSVFACGLTARTSPRDCAWTFGTPPLSNTLIVPLGSAVASCW